MPQPNVMELVAAGQLSDELGVAGAQTFRRLGVVSAAELGSLGRPGTAG